MNFGNVFLKLCSVIFILHSSIAYSQVDIPPDFNLKTAKEKKAYIDFIQKFDECSDKKLRKNNPYPVSDWLISLPKKKQTNVIVYLYRLSIYNCSLDEQNALNMILKKRNENKVLHVLQKEGWFKPPIYGELAEDKDSNLIILTEEDEDALSLLVTLNYLPFDGIGMHDLYQKLSNENNKD